MTTDVIYKYAIGSDPGSFDLPLPFGAQILSVGEQDGELFLWARVRANCTRGEHHRRFRLLWTGQHFEMPAQATHLSTVQMSTGLVVHIFEVIA